MQEGELIYKYLKPEPATGTGLHRYTFLVYKQLEPLPFEGPCLSDKTTMGRKRHSVPTIGLPVQTRATACWKLLSTTMKKSTLNCLSSVQPHNCSSYHDKLLQKTGSIIDPDPRHVIVSTLSSNIWYAYAKIG